MDEHDTADRGPVPTAGPTAGLAPVVDEGEGQEIEVDAAMLDAIERELEDVERALVLLDEGTYGRCEVCGQAIDEGRLTDEPATRFCAAHLPLTLG